MASSPPYPITVWIIEDAKDYRETISYVLDNTSGIQCTQQFPDCEAALGLLENRLDWEPPHVILLDINLPGMSGLEGIGQLKNHMPDANIVMLTIREEANTIYDALRAGASGYLRKEASLDQIVTAVREAAQGGTLMPADVASKVLSFFRQPEMETNTDYGLTVREKEVLHEMAEGYLQKEIADHLNLSPYTINSHVQHIYEKLHVHSNVEAVAKALKERLI